MSRESLQQEWARRLEEYSASGLSQKEWCQGNDVPMHQFNYWRGKLKQGKVARTNPVAAEGENGWWKLEVLPQPTQLQSALDVRVGAATIKVAPGFDAKLLAAVVQALGPGAG